MREIPEALGEDFVGLYVTGSAVFGDYDPGLSDFDMIAVLPQTIDEPRIDRLRLMHQRIVDRLPTWDDRLEVAYPSVDGLASYAEFASPMGIISPGEPLHIVEAGIEWETNWYLAQAHSVTVAGRPPRDVFPPVDEERFIESVRNHARAWTSYISRVKGVHESSYAVLTLCRALYTHQHGRHVSKRTAALYVAREYPRWHDLAINALNWRNHRTTTLTDPEAVTLTHAFLAFVLGHVNDSRS